MRINKETKRAKNIFGTSSRPRLAVFRSHQHIYAQIIDDEKQSTIAFASTLKGEAKGNKTEKAKIVGTELAKMAKEKGVSQVVFDRRQRIFHGRVAALATAAREGGLSF